MSSTHCIVNPRAGNGRAGRLWPALERRLRAVIGNLETTKSDGPGSATQAAARAVEEGAACLIAVGGDGTVNEVVNGMVPANGQSNCELAVIPVGSGTDFARGFGWTGNVEAAIDRAAHGPALSIDLGKVTYTNKKAETQSRLFVNIASLGVSGLIADKINNSQSRLPARLAYYLATLQGFAAYRFHPLNFIIDDGPIQSADIAAIVVANGRFFGSGMLVAPDALPDDGSFDIVILRGTSKWQLMKDLRLVYGGHHKDHPAVTMMRGKRIAVEQAASVDLVPLELDGEAPGHLPATFEVLPGALHLRC